MTRVHPTFLPQEVETLDQIEEWSHDAGLDFFDVLASWRESTNLQELHSLAMRSGITAAELVQRIIAANATYSARAAGSTP